MKIQTRTELQDNTVLLTNCLMKLPIFSSKNSKEITEITRESFNYNYSIRGYELNLGKDFEVFSALIRMNEIGKKEIHINDFLSEMGYKSGDFEWKLQEPIINALDRLNATTIKIENKDFICGFGFINDFFYDTKTKILNFSINERLKDIYKNDKFQRVINLNKFKGLNKTDRALLIYTASNDSKNPKEKNISFTVSRDKLKDRISPDSNNSTFNRQLKTSLKKLKKEGLIISSSELSNNVIGITYNKKTFMSDPKEMTKKDYIKIQKEQEIEYEIKCMEAEKRIKKRNNLDKYGGY